jgi:hypothetical protein
MGGLHCGIMVGELITRVLVEELLVKESMCSWLECSYSY